MLAKKAEGRAMSHGVNWLRLTGVVASLSARPAWPPWRWPGVAGGVAALVLWLSVAVSSGKEGAIQCANLVYAGTQTSRCFSDEFLSTVQRTTAVATERRFKSVKLASDELFQFPFVVMTGEHTFLLSTKERENMKRYLTSGGFVLASAGCSSKEWDQAFRKEIKAMFPDTPLQALGLEHPIFHSFRDIKELKLHHPAETPRIEGLTVNGKVVLVYSAHGLNDTAHTEGCCCCGGNEIVNSLDVNVNILVYALIH